MKKLIAGLVITIMIGAAVQAGVGPILGGVTVTDIEGGLTQVEGNMTAVRFSEDDVQTIGCRVRGDAGGVVQEPRTAGRCPGV